MGDGEANIILYSSETWVIFLPASLPFHTLLLLTPSDAFQLQKGQYCMTGMDLTPSPPGRQKWIIFFSISTL
jgi:hypothetical protein